MNNTPLFSEGEPFTLSSAYWFICRHVTFNKRPFRSFTVIMNIQSRELLRILSRV